MNGICLLATSIELALSRELRGSSAIEVSAYLASSQNCQKHDVFAGASMDGFTAVLIRG